MVNVYREFLPVCYSIDSASHGFAVNIQYLTAKRLGLRLKEDEFFAIHNNHRMCKGSPILIEILPINPDLKYISVNKLQW
jgi:hypothetical protein